MKSIFLQKKLSLLSTFAFVALATPAHAVVTWIVSEDGTGVTMSTSGSLDTQIIASDPPFSLTSANMGDTYLYASVGSFHQALVGTTVSSGFASAFSSDVGSYSFGHDALGHLFWDPIDGALPTSLSPTAEIRWDGETVFSLFGTSLDSGPVTVWTHNDTNDTIQVALVPEPSSATLLGLGCLGFFLRRSR